MADIFTPGPFRSRGGLMLPFKIECAALTDEDLRALSATVAEVIPFGFVRGAPTDDTRFSTALQPYRNPRLSTVLIAADVFTTGGSMERVRAEVLAVAPSHAIRGVAIFAWQRPPPWVSVIFQQMLWGADG